MLDLLDALSDLNEAYYQTPPEDRLPQLKRWLDEARSGNRRLAPLLTCPRFFRLDQTTGEKETICYRRSREYPPVPFLADRFTQRFLDCRVWEWISGQAPEPETGLILACRGKLREILGEEAASEKSPSPTVRDTPNASI